MADKDETQPQKEQDNQPIPKSLWLLRSSNNVFLNRMYQEDNFALGWQRYRFQSVSGGFYGYCNIRVNLVHLLLS